MGWKGKLVSVVNRAIAPLGIAIGTASLDFDARLTSEKHIVMMHGAMANAFAEWIKRQNIIANPRDFDIRTHVAAFYEAYLQAPFRDQHGGSRYNNALWLSLLARAIDPAIIVDSGTYTGASAWALSHGAPQSKIFSFDIDLSHLRRRRPNCIYRERDWSVENWDYDDTKNGLCYFDDHVDQARRLIEAHARGFRYAIFDDDYQIGSFAPMAHDSRALPKIEFILNDSLLDGETVTWIAGRSSHRWKVDRSYLDRARETIYCTERLPNTSLITGIHQTPYRLVRLASNLKSDSC
jgi:hypothetical protein